MDIKRAPKSKIKKKIRTALMIVIGLAAIGGITYGLTKLKPAAPTLDRSTAVIETVKRGEMVRVVVGNGPLGPGLPRMVPPLPTAVLRGFFSRRVSKLIHRL